MQPKRRKHINKVGILRVANALKYHIESRMKNVHCVYRHVEHW